MPDEAIGVAPDKPKEEASIGRWLLETAVLVLLAFVVAQGIKLFVVQPFIIPTGSMIPTIEINDRVLAEKLTYRFSGEPEVGDIVVFDDPTGEHPQLIKRVIATEGQSVDLRDGKVLIDGKVIDEPYTHGAISEPQAVALPVEVPKDNVWLMGDNRQNSGDSRTFGPQPISKIRGKAFWTYWPVSRFGSLD